MRETKNETNILVNKFRYHLRNDGLLPTIRRASRYLRLRLRGKKKWEEVANYATVEEKFQAIYEHNLWGNDESVSGAGSTFRQTVNLREQLPKVFTDYSVTKVFDAPCGDFNWMKHLLPTVDVDYIGGDVVPALIAANTESFANDRVSFLDLNLITDDYPHADLMICRDCLFHFSYADTTSALRKFLESGIPYLLTTTHTNSTGFENRDIETGDFRLMDLFKAPYSFPSPPLLVIDDWLPPEPERQMCLWSREQVASVLQRFGAVTGDAQTNEEPTSGPH
jgi:hypothetical protein